MKLLPYLGAVLTLYPWSLMARNGCRRCDCDFHVTSSAKFNEYLMTGAVQKALDQHQCGTTSGDIGFGTSKAFNLNLKASLRNDCDTHNLFCKDQRTTGTIWRLACNGGHWAKCTDVTFNNYSMKVKIFCHKCESVDCHGGKFESKSCCVKPDVTSINQLHC